MEPALEGEADRSLTAALGSIQQYDPPRYENKNLNDNDEVALPSLDDFQVAELLDLLRAKLHSLTNKNASAVNQTAQRFNKHQRTERESAPKTVASGRKKAYVRRKFRGYNPNKARNERNAELISLRKTAVDLQLELQRLQESKIGRSTNSFTADFDDRAPRVWQHICERQLARRVKSEQENARLQVILRGQIKITNSMEQLVKKHAQRANESCGSNKRSNG